MTRVQVDRPRQDRHAAPVLARLVIEAVDAYIDAWNDTHPREEWISEHTLSLQIFGPKNKNAINEIRRRVKAQGDAAAMDSDKAERILRKIGKRLCVVDT